MATLHITTHEANLLILGLAELQTQAGKLAKTAKRLNSDEMMKSAQEYHEALEELKTKLL